MKLKKIILFALCGIIFSCKSEPVDKICGIYLRSYDWEQKDLNTETVLGKSSIIDSIVITKKKDGYQIENSRWKKNDYDTEGWRDQAHSDNRPKPSHLTTYNKSDHTLNPTNQLMGAPIYLELHKGILYFNKKKEAIWTKVK